MYFIYGKINLGRIQSYKGNWINTSFVLIFIPLFPLQSKFVLERDLLTSKGFDIPKNRKSIRAAYWRLTFGLLWIYTLARIIFDSYYITPYTPLYFLIFFLTWIYFYFFYGRATKGEKELRDKMFWSCGIRMLPSWFDIIGITDFYKRYEGAYRTEFKSNWQSDLAENPELLKERKILYCLSLLKYTIERSEQSEQLFNKTDDKLNELIQQGIVNLNPESPSI